MKKDVKLCDINNFIRVTSIAGDNIINRKQFTSEIAIDPNEERTAVIKLTTIDTDRDGDVIVPEGIDLSEYESNPIVCWNHVYSNPPIGRVIAIQKTPNAVYAKVLFATTDFANEIWDLVKGGFLKCSSIGFISKTSLSRGTREFSNYINAHALKITSATKRIITSCTMIENSLVPIPANSSALIMAVAQKSIKLDKKLIKELGVFIDKKDYRNYYNDYDNFINNTVEIKAESDEEEGRWVTWNGRKIFIGGDGVARFGPGGKEVPKDEVPSGEPKEPKEEPKETSKPKETSEPKEPSKPKETSKPKEELVAHRNGIAKITIDKEGFKGDKVIQKDQAEKISKLFSNAGIEIDETLNQQNFKTAVTAGATINDLRERYPTFKDMPEFEMIFDDKYQDNVFATNTADGGYHYRDREMGFNTKLTSTMPPVGPLTLGVHHTVDRSISGTVRHEYGHHIGINLYVKEQKFEQELDGLFLKYNKISPKGVSSYATSSQHELFAEAFTAYTHSGYGKSGNKLQPDLENFMAKWIK